MDARTKRMMQYVKYRNKVLGPYLSWKEKRLNGAVLTGDTVPDFLGIGGHKCGSTWLYQNLKAHPQLFLPDKKELHYFDAEFHKGFGYYLDYFKQSGGRIKGEITPAYGILTEQRIAYIHHYFPQLKIVFLMRNPVERVWSHALMGMVSWGGLDPNKISAEKFKKHFHLPASSLRTNYGTIYENWTKFYPKEQVWFGFYEDIEQRPQALLGEVFTFLNVDVPATWEKFPLATFFNKGPEQNMPPDVRAYAMDLYREKIKSWEKHFGPRVLDWLK